MYEGRTRGKRAKYTFSDDENEFYSDSTNRRSTRNTRAHTPAEAFTTQSGRQVRPPRDVMTAGDGSGASAHGEEEDAELGPGGRPRRSAAAHHGLNGWSGGGGGRSTRSRGGHTTDDMDEDEDEDEEGTEFDGDDEKDEDAQVPEETEEEGEDDYDEDEAMVEDDLEDHLPRTRIVKLRVSPTALNKILAMTPPRSVQDEDEGDDHQRRSRDQVEDMPDAPPLLDSITASSTIIATTASRPPPPAQNHTPASSTGRQSTPDAAPSAVRDAQPLTPSAGRVGPSLAFRGSPEKPLAAV